MPEYFCQQRLVCRLILGLFVTCAAPAIAAKPNRPEGGERKARQDRQERRAAKAANASANRHAPSPEDKIRALRLAIEDLGQTFPDRYAGAPQYLRQLNALEKDFLAGGAAAAEKFGRLQHEALLANPLLDFDKLLLVKREDQGGKGNLGLPQNWLGNCALRRDYNNEIAVLSSIRQRGTLSTLYRPEQSAFVGDVDLHFEAGKLMFSMPSQSGRKGWHVWEINTDGTGLRRVTPEEPGCDWYDPCYLPDGRVICCGTGMAQGVPCIGGGQSVANLFRMDADGRNARQLCFDQDHDWCPTLLADGRVMYSRWEYADIPHYFSRLLFRMNPDGTGQSEYYGSNSYWPNSIFYARPIPGHPTKVVAVISGHHGVPRMGELVVFDTGKGRFETQGAVQRIPGHGRPVEAKVADQLVGASWPKFLHPFPLSDKHFLVSCQPSPQSPWGIYLVDVFDNLVPILELPGWALLEPVPLRKTPRAPVVPDRVDLASTDATVYLSNVCAGPGLKGVPAGTVKKLRVFAYHYAYRGMGGHIHVGVDGPWDVHRILGTVPVDDDGSASFRIPANTPVAVQPLDEQGQAVQVMRSWFVGMPGEVVSCAGCHESQNSGPPANTSLAMRRKPVEITPWHGPPRGFSFAREVQPVLDKYCVGCHDGTQATAGHAPPNLRGDRPREPSGKPNKAGKGGGNLFDAAYLALHPYVRRPGPESDYHLPNPYEFHASTSELVQMLRKGHHNVRLDAEAWDRLITWIDLNVPDHGTWGEHRKIPGAYHEQRLAMMTKYANRPEDPEEIVQPYEPGSVAFVPPGGTTVPAVQRAPIARRTPHGASQMTGDTLALDLDEGQKLELVLVPAGQYVMGDASGQADERPASRVNIARPFYMGKFEVTNALYRLFDPSHDSRTIHLYNKDHVGGGLSVDGPQQPVVRVSWQRAMAFCQWLSHRTGRRFSLPTEAQWEYACRAGSRTALSWGEPAVDFGKLANLADVQINRLTPRDSPRWIPQAEGVDDGATVTASVGRYAANAWGLFDMHGNAAEWTRTSYRPFPYDASDGRDSGAADGLKVVRGGSFYDRPARARSAFRLAYPPHQAVFNVGFRVVCDAE